MKKPQVVVIVPTYNEQESIERTLLQLEAVFQQISSHTMSILVFDSASTDSTEAIVKKLQSRFANIMLKNEPEKSGLGSAYIKAMQYVIDELDADIIFQYDADGSHRPHYIPDMLTVLAKGADVVVGSRYIPGGAIPSDWAFHRKCLSILGNTFIRCLLTRQYTDFTSGFRGIKVNVLKCLNFQQFLSNNYAFLLNLTWCLHQAGADIQEFPIQFIDRDKGYSKLPVNNIFESLRVVFHLRLQRLKHIILG